ncbi:MAG: response regulator, partial [Ignavibacteriales bacterium]|nr:response regulator [Ignavibacteriales bacterium]
VKQILVNHLSNAVKFTDDGEISVGVKLTDGMLSFSVRDSGIGIAETNLERVFEEFQQIENTSTKKYKGTGLGLPIARRLARLLGGNLTVKSVLGQGSTFTLRVPPVIPKENLASPDVVQKKQEGQPSSPSASAQKPAAFPATVAPGVLPPPGTRILCIDDDPDVIDILKKYLTPEGYSVTGANSGDEGIRLAEQLHPSLITLDIMMPNKDGWQVLQELKADSATRDIPVLIHSIIDNKPLAVHLGALDVMTKPVDAKNLIAFVGKVVHSKSQFVLVIDDDEQYATVMKALLQQDGYNAQSVATAEEALTLLKTERPALIIVDLELPGMSGIEFIGRVQDQSALKEIPIVILSGRALTKEEQEKVRHRILDYISKDTFSNESLSNTIRRILLQPKEHKP